MGLHLNWELRLPGTTTTDAVRERLAQLREAALREPFEQVSPLLDSSAASATPESRPSASLDFWASLVAQPYEDDQPPMSGDPSTAQGFFVQPGEGCETASFALLSRSDELGTLREWFWHCSCKTQYASVVSDEHLIKCHTSLVHVLERAIDLGFDVVVRDETHYWETRDEARLLGEVHRMNQIVARFAGALSDELAPREVRAPIFEHRRFERLEMGDE